MKHPGERAKVQPPKVRLPPDLYHRLRVAAASADTSLTAYVAKLLEHAVPRK